MQTGILFIGHGTRNEEGVAEFLKLAQLGQSLLSSFAVEACFLELQEPSISQGVARLVDRGCREIIASPVLLFAAGHAKRDIPAALESAASAQGISIYQSDHLGLHPDLLELSRVRISEATSTSASRSGRLETAARREPPTLLFVGRGSLDDEATAAMIEFAKRVTGETPWECMEVGFVAMAKPPLEEVLKRIASRNAPSVVVVPHLLFQGDLLDTIAAKVNKFQQEFPNTQWRLARHLGPDRRVANALVERVHVALEAVGRDKQNPE